MHTPAVSRVVLLALVASSSMLLGADNGCGGPGGGVPSQGPGSHPAADGGGNSTPGGSSDVDRARIDRANADCQTLVQATRREINDTASTAPACVTDLTNLLQSTCPTSCGHLALCTMAFPDPCWGGPYISSLMVDPWGTNYRATMNGQLVTVTSAGPDGMFDTADDLSFSG